MIIKRITKEEFEENTQNQKSQNGYTPLLDNAENIGQQINPEKDDLAENIKKIRDKKDNIIELKVVKDHLDDGIKLEDEYIKNARAIFKMHSDNRKQLRAMGNEDNDDAESGEEFDLKIQREIKDESSKKSINIEKYEDVICNILKQMYQGTLIDGKVSVRKDGIYPYRHQSLMDKDSVLANLIEKKDEVLATLKEKEKVKTMNYIYNSLETLNLKINSVYYRTEIEALKEEIIYLDKPFLLIDNFSGRSDSEIEPLYLLGIRIGSDGTIDWVGIHMSALGQQYRQYKSELGLETIEKDYCEIDINEIPMEWFIKKIELNDEYNRRRDIDSLTISYQMRKYLNKRFEKILVYFLSSFLNKMKLLNELIETSTYYLKQKGSKWLIMEELLNSMDKEVTIR